MFRTCIIRSGISISSKPVLRTNAIRVVVRTFGSTSTTSAWGFTKKAPEGEQEAPEKEDPQVALLKVVKAFQQNPQLMQLTREFKDILEKKGLFPLPEGQTTPSMKILIKMISDSEIRDHIEKLRTAMAENGIDISDKDFAQIAGNLTFLNKV
ncbi:uncharacterized protein J8A68_000957 [[Candida] subhashii]|uniref:Uncharacterized protein n=1 Tax=[Candida] subhashii TaxID=561895 RepID=A0A8J5V0L6_9ASCO|nr:uncharacterized protein J8A68_000957 [[Candida] subhashii]KAG7665555.1 hypothetical protein J8A68_000957 [[Candida] subhashii]